VISITSTTITTTSARFSSSTITEFFVLSAATLTATPTVSIINSQ